ncbi:MAG: hypothetical protein ACYSXF_04400, partial [Planctomycetota bacterium]
NPSGNPIALYVLGASPGVNSKKIGEDLEVLKGIEASLDLIFTEPNHTGVGFELSQFAPNPLGNWHITAYDKSGLEIGKWTVPPVEEPQKAFFGIWCPDSIGRINIWDEGIVPDSIDNIQMWEEPGGGGCTVFTDKASFEDFNTTEGKFLKGIEDFEESNIPDGGKQPLPAPLEGNVPNVDPDTGIGFPNGLTQKNLIIQDNITPGPNPPTTNPSGSPIALFVLGPGASGANSKKVGEDLEVLDGTEASLDLIFTEPNHTGVGFELSQFPGFPPGNWHITAYNKSGVEIGKWVVPPVEEPQKAFFGIWCSETIGRINIWDEGIIPDAVDNIQMWEEPAAECFVFSDKDSFDAFNLSLGKLLKGIEDFEESNVPPFGKVPLPAPLEGNVPNVDPVNGLGFPNGLAEKNLIIQDNIFPGPNPPVLQPSGDPGALFVIGPGSNNSNSKKVGEDLFLQGIPASLDLIFTEPNHTGVGFDLSRFEGFPNAGWHVTVYDKNDLEIGKFLVPPPLAPEPAKSFFGIWCEQSIGRINIFDDAGVAPDAVDNIQMWREPLACITFTDKAGFEDFNLSLGKLLKGIEDFEHGQVPAGAFVDLVDPLEGNVPNTDPSGLLGFPDGLINKNLKIQSNILGENAPIEAPGAGLRAVGPGVIAAGVPNSIVVGSQYPHPGMPGAPFDSLDLIFDPGSNHTGVGFDAIDPTAPPRIIHITVFDKNNAVIFKGSIPGTFDKTFFGIWCEQTIGRINLAGESAPGANDGAEYVDNIQMWREHTPCKPDINGDGVINVLDLIELLLCFGQPATPPCVEEDVNNDGTVNVLDLIELLLLFGQPCP